MESLEKILNIIFAVGLSLVITTILQFEPNIQKAKAISELSKKQEALTVEIQSIRSSLAVITAELDRAKGSQDTINEIAYMKLEQTLQAHTASIEQLNSLFTSDPAKARQLHDISQAYNRLTDDVSKLEEKIDGVQSQLLSGVLGSSSFYYGLAFVLLGAIGTILMQRRVGS